VIHEALRTAAILGRAGAVAPCADGIGLPSLRREPVLDANLMAPGDVQIVLVDEPGIFAQSQRRQRDVRRQCGHFPRTVTHRAEIEIIEVDPLPAHADLDHAMEFAERKCCRYENTAPNHRADPGEPDFDLQDRLAIRHRR
jgi:hypothetical protein